MRSGHNRAVDWWSLGALMYDMLTGAVGAQLKAACIMVCAEWLQSLQEEMLPMLLENVTHEIIYFSMKLF